MPASKSAATVLLHAILLLVLASGTQAGQKETEIQALRGLAQKDESLKKFLSSVQSAKSNLQARVHAGAGAGDEGRDLHDSTLRRLASEEVQKICTEIQNDVNNISTGDQDVQDSDATDEVKLENLKYACDCVQDTENNAQGQPETIVRATCSNSVEPLCLVGTDGRAFSGRFSAIFEQGLDPASTINTVNFCFGYTEAGKDSFLPVDASNTAYIGHTSCLKDPLLEAPEGAGGNGNNPDDAATVDCAATIDGELCKLCAMCDSSTESLQVDCSNLESSLEIPMAANDDPLSRIPPPRMIVDECYADDDAQSTAWQWWHPEVQLCHKAEKNNGSNPPTCVEATRKLQQDDGHLAAALNKVLERFYRYDREDFETYCTAAGMVDAINGSNHTRSIRPAGCIWDFEAAHPKLTKDLHDACEAAGGTSYWTGAKVLCEGDDDDKTETTAYFGLYNVPNCAANACTEADEGELQKDFDGRVRFTAAGMQQGLEGVHKCSVRQTFFGNDTDRLNDGLDDPIGPSYEDVTSGVCPSVASTILTETPILYNTDTTCGCPDFKILDSDESLEKNVLPVSCTSDGSHKCYTGGNTSFKGRATAEFLLDLSHFSLSTPNAWEHCFEFVDDGTAASQARRVCLLANVDDEGQLGCVVTAKGQTCANCAPCDANKDPTLFAVDCRNVLEDTQVINMCDANGRAGLEGTYLQFYDGRVRVDDDGKCDKEGDGSIKGDLSDVYKIKDGIDNTDFVIDVSSEDVRDDLSSVGKDEKEAENIAGHPKIVGPAPDDASPPVADNEADNDSRPEGSSASPSHSIVAFLTFLCFGLVSLV